MSQLESAIEKKLIEQLVSGPSQWTYREDLKTEEDLWNNFRYILEQNNKSKLGDTPLSDSEFEQVKNQMSFPSFYAAGMWLAGEFGRVYVHVQRGNDKLNLEVLNNEHIAGGTSNYEVINQYQAFREEGKENESERNRRFDVTLLINGIPLIHIELKNRDHSYMDGFHQIKKYIGEGKFKGIFSAVQMFVVTNVVDTRYFSAARDTELTPAFLTGWLDENNSPVADIMDFAKAVLKIPMAHEMIAKYTVLDKDRERLLLLRPYQIHAIEAMRTASRHGESGFIWHTTGSGKTMTSYKAARNLLMDIPSIDKTVFLIDRQDLDEQTTVAFQSYAKNDSVDVDETDNVTDLKNKLKNNDRQMIVTTKQKLHILLTKRLAGKEDTTDYRKICGKRIAFVVDECHRTLSPSEKREIEKFFSNSLWYGFTGTPRKPENPYPDMGDLPRTTEQLYGKLLHSYTVKEAIHDNNVLGFMVEYLGKSSGDENPAEYESEEHMREVLRVILNCSKNKLGLGKPKGQAYEAILTVGSIPLAQKYYDLLKRVVAGNDSLKIDESIKQSAPDFPKFAITYSLSETTDKSLYNQTKMQEALDDYNRMFDRSFTTENLKLYNTNLNERLARKNEKYLARSEQLDLVIVVDRLLTGFDAPCLSTVFIDRQPASPQWIIQTFSRTNRKFDTDKKFGQIVTMQSPNEFRTAVDDALKIYSSEGSESICITTDDWETVEKDFITAVRALKITAPSPDMVPGLTKKEKKKFAKLFQEMDKVFSHLRAFTQFSATSFKPEYGITADEYSDYEAHYNNVMAGIKADREEGKDDEDGKTTVDMDYHLSSYGMVQIDYEYIMRLIQHIMKTIDEGQTDEEKLQKMFEEAREYIDTYAKDNQKLADILHRILDDIEKDHTVYSGQNVSEIVDRMRREATDEILGKFCSDWYCSKEAVTYAAYHYNPVTKEIPSIVKESADYDAYSENTENTHMKFGYLNYRQNIVKELRGLLEEEIMPLISK